MPCWIIKTNHVIPAQQISINIEPLRYSFRKWKVKFFQYLVSKVNRNNLKSSDIGIIKLAKHMF